MKNTNNTNESDVRTAVSEAAGASLLIEETLNEVTAKATTAGTTDARADGTDGEGAIGRWQRWIRTRPTFTAEGDGLGRRVLLISYIFPPTGGSGTQRPSKLAKHLHEFGWQVEVLTAGHQRFPWIDHSLCDDIPARCQVHRVAGHEPACLARRVIGIARRFYRMTAILLKRASSDETGERIFGKTWSWIEDRLYWRFAAVTARMGLGNGESLWVRPAARAAVRHHRARPFDMIVSTGPPHLAHKVAMRIARKTSVPWVAEMRDPLVSDYDLQKPLSRHVAAMRKLEAAILRRAAKVVVTSAAFADDLRARFPHRVSTDIRTITNGFDRDDIFKAGSEFASHTGETHRCVFVTAGAFYGRNKLTRLTEPMQRVLDRHPEWRGKVELVVAGKLDADQQAYWRREKRSWIRFMGYLDHGSAIGVLARSSCAVMTLPDCQHSRHCIPGKTFELISLPKHLLALVPSGSETERIVHGADAATTAPLEDAVQVEAAIEKVVADHFAGRLLHERTWSNLDHYDRRSIAAAMADCLSSVVDETRCSFSSDT